MLNIEKILKRSWHILWSYKLLWVFGFLLALTAGGSSMPRFNSFFNNRRPMRPTGIEVPRGFEGLRGDTFAEKLGDGLRQMGWALQKLQEQHPQEFRLGIALMVTFFAAVLLFSLLGAFLRYTAETASIRMVAEYEFTGLKVGFRQAWRYGWSRQAWRLFLVNFVVHLPVLALFVVLGLAAWWVFSAILGGVRSTIFSAVIAASGLAFLLIFITAVVMVVFYVLRDFAWRLVALDGAGVMESLRLAWALVKRHWKNVGLVWLVMVGLKIAWGILFFILVFPLLVVSIFTAVAGLLVAVLPALLTAGVASLLSAPSYWPWLFAAVIALPFFFVVAFSPILLVSGWWRIYQSSTWTLTYRELKALEAVSSLPPELEPQNAPDAGPEAGPDVGAEIGPDILPS